MSGPSRTAVFHDAPAPTSGVPRVIAELVDDDREGGLVPYAVAWLRDFSDATALPPFVSLDFILVPDMHRRKGYATELVEACHRRWPGLLWLTDAISPEGEILLESLERKGIETEPMEVQP